MLKGNYVENFRILINKYIMKKLLFIIAFAFIGCSTPDKVSTSNKVASNNIKTPQLVTNCGTIHTLQTMFTGGIPSTFIGVRYDLNLDTPYNGFTKAYFILNDALNTPLTNQFTNLEHVCRNDLIYY